MKKTALIILMLTTQGVSLYANDNSMVLKEKNHNNTTWAGVKTPIVKKGNYFMPTGFVFDCALVYAIMSYNLMTPCVAEADEDVYYLGDLVIPKGTRLIGVVQVAHSLDRVTINFQTLVFPDGQEISFQGVALWYEDGSAGIKGKVVKHKDVVAGRIALKSVLAAVSASAQLATPGVEAAMVGGFTNEAQQSIDTAASKATVLESISVEEKTAIKVFVTRRVDY